MSKRLNISIPDLVWAELQTMDFNISKVCTEALRKAIAQEHEKAEESYYNLNMMEE